MLNTNGDDLYLDFSRAEAEALLRECDNVLPKVSECHGPIDADTWDGLGKIRDGLVELSEKKFGADNNLSTMLKFDRLDSQEMSSLSHDMNVSASEPSSVAERGDVSYRHPQRRPFSSGQHTWCVSKGLCPVTLSLSAADTPKRAPNEVLIALVWEPQVES